jgi:cytochrome P450
MAGNTALSEAVQKPDHVPESLVYDFDMFKDPAYIADPHNRIIDIIKTAPPIFWTPRNGGHWMLVSHEANFEAARDIEKFSNELMPQKLIDEILAQLPAEMGRIPQAFPITLDPPAHTKYRLPLQKVFSPKTINALQDSIRALAVELIDEFAGRGHCNIMTEVAELFPVEVFLKMLGLPLEKLAEYRQLVADHLGNSDPMHAVVTLQQVAAAMRDTIEARRDNPRDDILSMLWKVEIDGAPITIEDIENYGVLLFIAGLDTVMQGIGHGVRHLAMDQALQKKLRENPELIKDASEELLRRYTFTVPPRRVAKDLEFLGVKMKADERAMLFLPAADLDPKEYADPAVYKLDRESAHIAFNAGPHRCLGSHLARVELQVLYEELLARVPQFRLDPNNPPRFHGGHVIGVDSLNLVWEV